MTSERVEGSTAADPVAAAATTAGVARAATVEAPGDAAAVTRGEGIAAEAEAAVGVAVAATAEIVITWSLKSRSNPSRRSSVPIVVTPPLVRIRSWVMPSGLALAKQKKV